MNGYIFKTPLSSAHPIAKWAEGNTARNNETAVQGMLREILAEIRAMRERLDA